MASRHSKTLVVAASDNEAMAKLAKPGLSATFDVFPLISKWSLEFQASKQDGLKPISSVASRALQELVRLASSGHAAAAKSLHRLVVSYVSQFDELCHETEFLKHFELISRKNPIWPGLLSCDADINKRNKQLLVKLKLGTQAGLNYSGRQWTRDTPETSVALKLWGIVKVCREGWQNRKAQAKLMREYWEKRNQELGRPARFRPQPKPLAMNAKLAKQSRLHRQSQKLARNLEPLDRKNYKLWFEAAMPEFINFYGEEKSLGLIWPVVRLRNQSTDSTNPEN